MAQLITTLLSVMTLLVAPLGVVQIHTIMQTRSELMDISFSTTTYISNRGGVHDLDVQNAAKQFVYARIAQGFFHLDENDLTIQLTRTEAADPIRWSHRDQFRLYMSISTPLFTSLFSSSPTITIERIGTINVMDYDL